MSFFLGGALIGFLIGGFLGIGRLLMFHMRRFLRFLRREFLWYRGQFLLWLLLGRGQALLCGFLVLRGSDGPGGLLFLFCRLSC